MTGLALLPVRLVTTFWKYLAGSVARFRVEEDETSRTNSISLAPPLVYAAIFCYCNAFSSMVEDLARAEGAPASVMSALFSMMQAGLESGSAVGVFKGGSRFY